MICLFGRLRLCIHFSVNKVLRTPKLKSKLKPRPQGRVVFSSMAAAEKKRVSSY